MIQLNTSIVVPSRGDAKRLRAFLSAFARYESEIQNYQLIIIVNGPHNQNEISLLRKNLNLNIEWIFRSEAHVNKARNLGLERAQKDFVLFLDDDCLIPDVQFWVVASELVRLHSDSAHGGFYKAPSHSSMLSRAYWINSQSWLRAWSTTSTPYLIGGLILIPRQRIKNLVSFNPFIAFGSSELDFAEKLRAHNIPVLMHPDWQITHNSKLKFKDYVLKAILQGLGAKKSEYKTPESKLHSKQNEIEAIKKELLAREPRSKRPFYKLLFYLYNKMYSLGYWNNSEVAQFVLSKPYLSVVLATTGRLLKIKTPEHVLSISTEPLTLKTPKIPEAPKHLARPKEPSIPEPPKPPESSLPPVIPGPPARPHFLDHPKIPSPPVVPGPTPFPKIPEKPQYIEPAATRTRSRVPKKFNPNKYAKFMQTYWKWEYRIAYLFLRLDPEKFASFKLSILNKKKGINAKIQNLIPRPRIIAKHTREEKKWKAIRKIDRKYNKQVEKIWSRFRRDEEKKWQKVKRDDEKYQRLVQKIWRDFNAQEEKKWMKVRRDDEKYQKQIDLIWSRYKLDEERKWMKAKERDKEYQLLVKKLWDEFIVDEEDQWKRIREEDQKYQNKVEKIWSDFTYKTAIRAKNKEQRRKFLYACNEIVRFDEKAN